MLRHPRSTEARFPTYGLLKITETSQSVHLDLQRQALQEDARRGPYCLHHVRPRGSPRLPTKRSSRDAARRGTGIHWWLVHGGAPAHCLTAVRQFWNSLFPEHRTGRYSAHHCGNICSLPFVLQQSASPALATADIECGSRGFTACQAT